MRKLMRSVAHANMEAADIPHMNRSYGKNRSFFARNWRNFLYRWNDKKAQKAALRKAVAE